ncbi:MAG: lysophospholipid acyltransferase family protein [Bacteroidales bacterium]|nr:lysophospholipid acyltransferase family protein [Bacteroidales bacterium]
MNLFLTILFIFFVFLIGIIPFRILYFVSDFLRLFLSGVLGYRKKVISRNLKRAFPNLDENEEHRLIRLIYKNLTDVIVEGLKSFTMTRRQINKHHKIENPEILTPYFEQGKSIIAVAGHYANWEWGSLSASLQTDYNVVALYKPLSNKGVDKFMRWTRTRSSTELASIYKTSKVFEKCEGSNTIFLMAADQSPTNRKKAYWIAFFGRETAFLHGPEKYARKYNYPVLYVDVQRKKRGFYTVFLSVLAENPSKLQEGEITEKYANKLESIIRKQPESWLWSHRRWKLSR